MSGTTRWASGSIAGIALNDSGGRDIRTDLIGGESFRSALVGSSVVALDLSVHTQLIARSLKAVHFGIHVAQMPVSVRNAIITAIEAAIGAGNAFLVVLSDSAGIDNISVHVVPDFAALNGQLYKRGGMAAGYIKDVEFRFVSTGA